MLSHHDNEAVQKIYKILGPLDFFIKKDNELKESLENETRQMQSALLVKGKSNNRYRGEVNDSQVPEGRGFKIYSTGGIYEGYFQEGKMEGYGRGVSSLGNCFEGTFENDEMHGYGIYIDNEWKWRFEGMWKRGKKVGNFKVYDWVGGVLEILFTNDLAEGKGTYKISDWLTIEAFWRAGLLNGKLHAKFPHLKAEMEVFFKDGAIDGKERVIKGEVTEQMK